MGAAGSTSAPNGWCVLLPQSLNPAGCSRLGTGTAAATDVLLVMCWIKLTARARPAGNVFHPTCPCSHGNRDTALREAPTLLRVCQSLVEAGPGSCEASRIHYECAFTVLASFIQHPQHGSALAALLVDHACTLVMRQEGPTTSDGLQPGSSQSVYRWAGSANACNMHGRGTCMWPDQHSVPCQSASCSGVLVNCCRLCSAAHALPGPTGLTMCNDCNDSRAVPWLCPAGRSSA